MGKYSCVDWLIDGIFFSSQTSTTTAFTSYPLGKPMIEALLSFLIGGIAGALISEYTHPCRDCFKTDGEFTGDQL